MTSDLLDDEGFPRADLDIPIIREARNRIQRLRNDRREVEAQLATLLTHALPPSSVPRQEAVAVAQSDGVRARRMAVRSVSTNGPADKAVGRIYLRQGLCAGDELVRWGPWDPMTTEHMSELTTTVKEGVSIPIVVRRTCLDGRTIDVSLTLTPTPWDGRGLLGCHLVPL